MVKTDSWSSGL